MSKIKSRKLYLIRHYHAGQAIGVTVGHKCRLLPRAAATRIAQRLRRSGLDVQIAPLMVNVTPEQVAYLRRRYA
ncbi:hypothetical protein ACU4GI_32975 [Cupriavidus basilensis]